MDLQKNINIFVEEQFSSNYRENGALLVEFMECYYKWGEESGNFVDASRSLNELYDVDAIAEEFLDFLHNEFLGILPKDLKTNKRTLIKNILSFYQSRGTEDAYKMLFRILYNQEINVYYPGRDILRASDGKWYIGKRLEILSVYTDDLTDIPEIIGSASGAIARIENATTFLDNSVLKTSIFLTSIRGTFVKDEDILVRYSTTVVGKVISDGLITDQGYWLNTDGHISSDKRIQDNFYYQDYSYEIQSTVPLIDYRNIAGSIVHPAGTKLFGKVLNNIQLDLSYNEVKVDATTISGSGAGLVLDLTTLSATEAEIFNITTIVDHTYQETLGAGQVSMNLGLIGDFVGFSINDFGHTPISRIGTQYLIIGTGTSFTATIGQPNGPNPGIIPATIKVQDDDNSYYNIGYTVDKTYSNRFLDITDAYPYPTFTLEDYTLGRSISEDVVAYGTLMNEVGTGTITWDDANQNFDGTGTAFTTEVAVEDIIEIISTGDRFLVSGITSNTALTILKESQDYSSIVDEEFRIYKVETP